MAYRYTNKKGKMYFLHGKPRLLKDGKKQMLYYFAKEAGAAALDAVPAGYEVVETKTGLPVLKKK